MISTVPVSSVVTLTRSPFVPLLDASGAHRHDRDGQPLYACDAFVPGSLRSPFARPDQAGPGEIRIRTVGDPGIGPNTAVRLDGDVRVSAWKTGRGGAARTDVVVTAERVTTTSDRPELRGPLTAVWPAVVPMMFLDYLASQRAEEPGRATVGIAPVDGSPWVVDGLAELTVRTPPAVDLYPGMEVLLINLVVGYHVADNSDRQGSSLVLGADRIEPEPKTNGRSRRSEPEQTAEVSA